jgi:excinuclease ABC subunit C
MTPSGEIRKKLDSLPDAPGVYLFLDARGRTIYVGKARSLRKRVRQYFTPSSSDTRFLIQHIRRSVRDIETIATAGDREALLLENTLIKERQPRYNVRLRDDKDYLCIRLDTRARWPRIELSRRPRPDGARYFGPYHSARAARSLARFLTRHFKLRSCKDTNFAARKRPCLQHEIGRCLAPCTLQVDHDAYTGNVGQALLYLEGRVDDLVKDLERQMETLSASMAYEEAAEIRDRLQAIEATRETQRVAAVTRIDQDVLAVARTGDRAALAILFFRRGRLVGMREERLRRTELPDAEIVASFVGQYYGADRTIPHEILLPLDIDEREHLESVLTEIHGRKVRLHVPRRGAKRDLVSLATENARRIIAQWDRLEDPSVEKLERLQSMLSLPGPPARMECVDISHTSGRQTVGSLSVTIDGTPSTSHYRRFRIRTAAPGDDYAAMHELLSRRFRRAHEEGWEPPDLLVVDGGKGQLGIAREVIRELGVEGVALAAIAKDRRRQEAAEARRRVKERIASESGESVREEPERTYDTIYLPGRTTGLPVRGPTSPLTLLVKLRDEAHRFAVDYHRKVRSRASLGSRLTDIPHVGPATARKLLRALGSLKRIRAASEQDLVDAGASRRAAASIRAHLSAGGRRR